MVGEDCLHGQKNGVSLFLSSHSLASAMCHKTVRFGKHPPCQINKSRIVQLEEVVSEQKGPVPKLSAISVKTGVQQQHGP